MIELETVMLNILWLVYLIFQVMSWLSSPSCVVSLRSAHASKKIRSPSSVASSRGWLTIAVETASNHLLTRIRWDFMIFIWRRCCVVFPFILGTLISCEKSRWPTDSSRLAARESGTSTTTSSYRSSGAVHSCLASIRRLLTGRKKAVVIPFPCNPKLIMTLQMLTICTIGYESWLIFENRFRCVDWYSAADHPRIKPKSFLNPEICEGFSKDFMFLGCIQYIHKVLAF